MKRIMVLGAGGMAGHMVFDYLSSLNKYDIVGISHTPIEGRKYIVLDVEEKLEDLAKSIEEVKPDVIINCIGLLVKDSENCPPRAIYINSFFPHVLEYVTKNLKTKVIHLSTDCIFNGKGEIEEDLGVLRYPENFPADETNWYGRTKALGEINNKKDLTFRMSIIGPELKEKGTGLFNWFMHQTGEIEGYSKVYWNGITTLELAKNIDKAIEKDLVGLYHLVCNSKISKYDLLLTIKEVFEKEIVIKKNNNIVSDKTLFNTRNLEDFKIPSYQQMLQELKEYMNKK